MRIIFCSECGVRLPSEASIDDPRCPDCQAGRTRRHSRRGDSGALPRATVTRLLNQKSPRQLPLASF